MKEKGVEEEQVPGINSDKIYSERGGKKLFNHLAKFTCVQRPEL